MPVSIRAVRPSNPAFTGEASGIDITRTIGREDGAAIEAGMDPREDVDKILDHNAQVLLGLEHRGARARMPHDP
jgi:hypothetical protein